MSTEIKIVLQASFIPVNSKVTKKTGTYSYTITDTFTIFKDKGSEENNQVIKAEGSSRFLVSEVGRNDISCINGRTELIWHTDAKTLKEYLENMLE